MFQTVGHQLIDSLAKAMNLPLYRRPLVGKSVVRSMQYIPNEDETVRILFFASRREVRSLKRNGSPLVCLHTNFAIQLNPVFAPFHSLRKIVMKLKISKHFFAQLSNIILTFKVFPLVLFFLPINVFASNIPAPALALHLLVIFGNANKPLCFPRWLSPLG